MKKPSDAAGGFPFIGEAAVESHKKLMEYLEGNTVKAPTQEQLNDSAWWDRVAPEGAEFFTRALGGHVAAFWKKDVQWMMATEGTDWDFKFGISIPDEQRLIPRPTKPAAPEWDGEGKRPPVGMRCAALSGKRWRNGRVIWHREGNDIDAVLLDDDGFSTFWADKFRPIRTPEQRDRDDLAGMIEALNQASSGNLADAIIAAGWRKGE